MGWLWRRTVWQRIGQDAHEMGGSNPPVAVWGGWRVTVGAATVTWRAGLFGSHTVLKLPSGKRRFRELLPAERVRRELGA